ncbi:hypothetical protein F5J12DRAFT_782145 [Pisolithus orientalis]|uniref:uncharacterized protein n=1 Tax=Pisolithus orientalis TaxID=936130 RepID=UPI0022242182|nr:uncharacterized protein F5J12DRAFT_782145 [Pisolithus orientalis]KAI6009654.1 hypothetical protein F5J12DRAFT_782145 [Pisolithus orientalis]
MLFESARAHDRFGLEQLWAYNWTSMNSSFELCECEREQGHEGDWPRPHGHLDCGCTCGELRECLADERQDEMAGRLGTAGSGRTLWVKASEQAMSAYKPQTGLSTKTSCQDSLIEFIRQLHMGFPDLHFPEAKYNLNEWQPARIWPRSPQKKQNKYKWWDVWLSKIPGGCACELSALLLFQIQ